VRCDCKAVKYSNSLQLTATHCSTLQHAATHNDDGADSWEIYQCAVTIELQCTATHCNTLQHTATHNNNDTDFWKYPPDTLYDGLCILLIFCLIFSGGADFWEYLPVTLYDGLWILLNIFVSFFFSPGGAYFWEYLPVTLYDGPGTDADSKQPLPIQVCIHTCDFE